MGLEWVHAIIKDIMLFLLIIVICCGLMLLLGNIELEIKGRKEEIMIYFKLNQVNLVIILCSWEKEIKIGFYSARLLYVYL